MDEFLNTLNSKQKEAVLHTGNPLLILAGAGSGKTRVITTKIAYLLNNKGYDPYSILAVTFTNKAAGEMKSRVIDMVPENGNKVMIRTFHSFGAWLLRRNGHALGLADNFNIYDSEDKKALLKTITGKQYPPPELKHIANCISRAKEKCLLPGDEALMKIDDSPEVWDIYDEYQKRLNTIGNVDFGDLIMQPVRLLTNFPEVQSRLQQRFRVIMVDEFQDTNTAQFRLLEALYDKTNYICVVGDEDQSIYKFRGAEVENIITFPDHFENSDVIMLEQNYRSTPEILDVALEVVKNNELRMGKELWTRNKGGRKVHLAYVGTQDEEALLCREIVARALEEGETLSGTAILYRNNYQSRAFETLFNKSRIPYRVIGSLKFYEREEIKDVVAWLFFIMNPRDEISFRRIINKPARGIGPKSLTKILEAPGRDITGKCRFISGKLAKKAREGVEDLIINVDKFISALKELPLAGLIEKIYTESGLLDYYKDKDDTGAAKVQNIYELTNATRDYGPGMKELARFLENCRLDSSGNENPFENRGQVTLITIHNTKGLEFDRVILTGLEDGLFPHISDSDGYYDEDIEEERRLFYVGITRARKELYLTSCRYRRVYGRLADRVPSRFLSEIPEKLLKIMGAQTKEDGYNEGDYVYHPEYGTGIIQKTWKSGANTVVGVLFDGGKVAQFIPEYTKLERIQYD